MRWVRVIVGAALVIVAIAGCGHHQPEAKVPESLRPCDLLPRDAAIRATDVGSKIGPPQAKETKFLRTVRYCEWDYRQPKKHFWSSSTPGAVERTLIVELAVYSAKSGGAGAAAAGFESDQSDARKNGETPQPVSGIGENAFTTTSESSARPTRSTVEFRWSNALVKVTWSGRDCCRGDIPAGRRQALLLAATKVVEQELITR